MDDISADTADFPLPPSLASRREQMFPKLAPAEINRLRRFGTVHTWQPGEILFEASKTRTRHVRFAERARPDYAQKWPRHRDAHR